MLKLHYNYINFQMYSIILLITYNAMTTNTYSSLLLWIMFSMGFVLLEL